MRKRLVHMVNLLTLEHAICHINHTVNNHPHIVHHALKGKPSKIILFLQVHAFPCALYMYIE